MHVVMLGHRAVPADYGGVERHVEELGAELVELGHRVTVLNRTLHSDHRRRHRGMDLRDLPSVPGRHLDASLHSAVATAAATVRRPDVIHVHAVGPAAFTPLPRLAGVPVVVTVHGLDQDRAKWAGGARQLLRAAAWVSAHVPDAVIAVSREVAEHYERVGTVPVHHITNGVRPTARPDPAPVRALDLEPGRYAVAVGRLVPEKAADVAVAAWRELGNTLPLVMVGDAAYTETWAATVEASARATPGVRLIGHRDRSTVAALQAHAAVALQLSRLEGLPLTLLEVAAAGTPVVVSDIPPHREVVGHSAPGHRVVPVDDPTATAAALRATLADPDAASTGAAALARRVRADHAWGAVAAATAGVYVDAVTGSARRRRRAAAS